MWRTEARLDGHQVIREGYVTVILVEAYVIMAHDHCCIVYCNNDKRNESGENLSFFNFPSNSLQRSQWIAAIKRDEGPLFGVSVRSRDERVVKRKCLY